MIVYVSIGNSDDKLSQQEWHDFVNAVLKTLIQASIQRHGVWFSLPQSQWQNACWCVEFDDAYPEPAVWAKRRLGELAAEYRQDSIAWAVAETEFIAPEPSRV